jgi:CHAT domain-containing protein
MISFHIKHFRFLLCFDSIATVIIGCKTKILKAEVPMQAALAFLFILSFWNIASAENRPIAIGQTLESRLGESSPQRDGVTIENWEIIGRAGQTITIEATSNEFDPLLSLSAADGKVLATDDNGGTGLNARITIKLPSDGRYQIETSTAWQKRGGNYRLSVVEGETPIKTGNEKLSANLEYLDLCLRVTTNPAWKSELNSGKILPLLGLKKDDDALKAAEEAVGYARESGDNYALSKAFFTIATGFVLYEEYQRAIPYFEETLKIRREMKDRSGEAAVLSALGSAYQMVDDYEKARDYFQQSLTMQRELKNQAEERFALYGLAESHRFLKQYEKAISIYDQVLSIGRQADSRYNDGYVLMGMANCYRALNKYDQAFALYEQALQTGRVMKDRTLEAISLGAMGDSYRYLGDFEKAIPRYEQTLAIRREIKDRRGEAYTLNGLAECARSLNQFQSAISNYQQMLVICRENKDKRGESIALNGLGVVYRANSQPQQAIENYEEALKVLREVKDRKGEYIALLGIASAHRAVAQPERALPFLEQALAMNTGNPEIGNLEPVLTSLAAVSFAFGQYEKAANYCERVLSIKQEGKPESRQENKSKNGEATISLLLASSHRALSRSDQAIAAYRQALTLFQEIKDAAGEYSCYHNIAELMLQKNDWQAAQTNWESALKVIEFNPGAILVQDATPGLVTPSLVYQNYVDALAAQQQFAPALAVAERARAHEYRLAIWSYGQSAKVVEETMKQLPPASFEQIQQTAQRLGVTIIEYMPTQRGLASWVVKGEGSILGHYEVIDPARLNALLTERRSRYESKNSRSEKLRQAIIEPSLNAQAATPDAAQSIEGDLYKILFPQVIEEALPAETGARLLLIAPGRMGIITFADLQDGQGRLLIDRFTLLYGPSATALVASGHSRSSEEDPARSGSLVLAGPNSTAFNGKTVPTLDEIKDEIKEVTDSTKTKAIMGAMATKASLREQSSGKQIIHLAAYGYSNDRRPLGSFIALAPEMNEQGEILQDGLLTADELRTLTLNTDLLVLSSFHAGFNSNGDGFAAFAHSLALAGPTSTVMTLWSVDAKPTALFMKTFYQRLKKSNDITESFRQAMLKTKEKYKDPSQWAGFILLGGAKQEVKKID